VASVYPIEILPNTFRGHYPNMAKRDAVVWHRFLEHYATRFTGFAYNVAMGGLLYDLPGTEPADKQAWQYHTALKIDAVGFTEATALIIEVKPEAQCGALGAVIAYAMTAARLSVFDRPVKSAIVCEYCQPDVQACCNELGIAVFVV
jgi:hypothetical protein